MKGVTTTDAGNSQTTSPENPVFAKCLKGIAGTTRVESTARTQKRRDKILIESDQGPQKGVDHSLTRAEPDRVKVCMALKTV
jgi:hypothetical protein